MITWFCPKRFCPKQYFPLALKAKTLAVAHLLELALADFVFAVRILTTEHFSTPSDSSAFTRDDVGDPLANIGGMVGHAF